MPLCIYLLRIPYLFKSLPKNANEYMSKKDGKEVPPCTCAKSKKASFTLEAAIIVPLTAGFLAMLLFFFRVMQVETEVNAALNYASRQTAAMASLSDSEGAELAIAESLFLAKLSQGETAKNYLTGTQKLFALADSNVGGEYVDLVADYRINFPIPFFPIKDIHIRQESRSRKWIGTDAASSEEDAYVYVTEYGTVYHLTKNCKYMDLSIQTANAAEIVTLRNINGHKYYACERCVAKNSEYEIVYITDYGECFHGSLQCSGLKRTVSLVQKSEVSDKKLCSKCAKNSK